MSAQVCPTPEVRITPANASASNFAFDVSPERLLTVGIDAQGNCPGGGRPSSDYVLGALIDRRACLMANHGMVCFTTGLDEVPELAIDLEHLASVYC